MGYETVGLDRLDEIAHKLPAGDFATQVEIADYFGVSPPMARKLLDKGIELGLWTEENVGRGLALGKRLRAQGKTEAPIRPDMGWLTETLPENGNDFGTKL